MNKKTKNVKLKFLRNQLSQWLIISFIFQLPIFIISPFLHAQQPKLQFEHISLNQGLSQSIVNVILKDKKGFMWFGTESGLNKYDGYNFTIY